MKEMIYYLFLQNRFLSLNLYLNPQSDLLTDQLLLVQKLLVTGILKLPLGLLTFGALGFTAGLGAAAGAFGTPCGVGGFVVFCGAHGIWNDCCCFLGAAFLGC